jgi:hypothetical protein
LRIHPARIHLRILDMSWQSAYLLQHDVKGHTYGQTCSFDIKLIIWQHLLLCMSLKVVDHSTSASTAPFIWYKIWGRHALYIYHNQGWHCDLKALTIPIFFMHDWQPRTFFAVVNITAPCSMSAICTRNPPIHWRMYHSYICSTVVLIQNRSFYLSPQKCRFLRIWNEDLIIGRNVSALSPSLEIWSYH